MCRLFVLATSLALLGFALSAPAEPAKDAEVAKPAGDGKEDVEGRIGYGGGFGGGAFGSGFNRGGSFGVGSQGNQYGQSGFGYNVGGTNRRDYGNAQTYGDRETFGLSSSSGANRRHGQSSFGNRRHNQEHGAGGSSFGTGQFYG